MFENRAQTALCKSADQQANDEYRNQLTLLEKDQGEDNHHGASAGTVESEERAACRSGMVGVSPSVSLR